MIQFIYWFIDKFIKQPTIPNLTYEQEMGLFSQLYDNASFRKYLNARERYLVDKHTEDFILGKLNNSYGLAGQLIEVRNIRERIKIAYKVMESRRKSSLKQAPK